MFCTAILVAFEALGRKDSYEALKLVDTLGLDFRKFKNQEGRYDGFFSFSSLISSA